MVIDEVQQRGAYGVAHGAEDYRIAHEFGEFPETEYLLHKEGQDGVEEDGGAHQEPRHGGKEGGGGGDGEKQEDHPQVGGHTGHSSQADAPAVDNLAQRNKQHQRADAHNAHRAADSGGGKTDILELGRDDPYHRVDDDASDEAPGIGAVELDITD